VGAIGVLIAGALAIVAAFANVVTAWSRWRVSKEPSSYRGRASLSELRPPPQ
jgi:hypothetical protein